MSIVGIIIFCTCWALPTSASSSGSDAVFIQDKLMTYGILEIKAQAQRVENNLWPTREVVESALITYFGYKEVTILEDDLTWASHWSLRPGITKRFSIRFSAVGVAGELRIGGLARVLQNELNSARAGVMIEAAFVNSLKWIRTHHPDPDNAKGTAGHHAWSIQYSLFNASVASSAGVVLAFGTACLASMICQHSRQVSEVQLHSLPLTSIGHMATNPVTKEAPPMALGVVAGTTQLLPPASSPANLPEGYITIKNAPPQFVEEGTCKDRAFSTTSTTSMDGDEFGQPMSFTSMDSTPVELCVQTDNLDTLGLQGLAVPAGCAQTDNPAWRPTGDFAANLLDSTVKDPNKVEVVVLNFQSAL